MEPDSPTAVEPADDPPEPKLVAELFGGVPATAQVGRYRVLDEIGGGAIGQVLSAYDEELDRKVAIKIVHAQLCSDDARARLRREAQALGRLAHPNLVAIHEIGDHRGRIFLAMEFVRGRTLRAWLAEHPRTVPQILEVYLQAARGLQAAHEAGLLHRDFKPDNALHGEDGRVRLVDFGLARTLEEVDLEAERASTLPSGATEHDKWPTRTGAVLGTPSYMAPEQFLGEVTDARTDQFAFCIALWEALYGQRPFVGAGHRELADNVVAGARRPLPRDAKVPAPIRALLETGLSREPAQRHPDMATIVTLLERALLPRRSRWWLAVLVVPIVGATALALFPGDDAPVSLERCAPAQERLTGVWDEPVRDRLAKKFSAAAGPPFVASSWASIERELDEAAGQWRSSYEGACRAARSPVVHERRFAARRLGCLDQALPQMQVFVELVDRLPAREVAASWALEIGDGLAMRCDDAVVRLLPPPPEDAAVARRVADLEVSLMRAQTRGRYGRPAEGLELAHAVIGSARALGHRPTLAWALTLAASYELLLQRPEGKATLAEAISEAEAAGADLTLWNALLLSATASERGADALERAEPIAVRLGNPPRVQLELDLTRHKVLARAGDEDGALAVARRVAQRFGDDRTLPAARRLAARSTLISALWPARPDEVLEASMRAVALIETELGPDHPLSLAPQNMAVVALRLLGRDEESVAGARRLVTMSKATYPEGHPQTGWELTELATSLDNAGRLRESLEAYAEAEVLFGRLLGESHPDVMTYATLALAFAAVHSGDARALRVRVDRSRPTQGLRPVVRAWWDAMSAMADAYEGELDDARATLAALLAEHAGNPKVEPMVRMYAAEVERRAGDIAGARALAEPALAIVRAGAPPSHGRRGEPLHWTGEIPAFLGALRVESGASAEGIPLLEEALQAAASIPEPDVIWYAPLANYWLAVALADTGGDMSQAIQRATTARSQAAIVDPGGIGIAELATTFLREHGEDVP